MDFIFTLILYSFAIIGLFLLVLSGISTINLIKNKLNNKANKKLIDACLDKCTSGFDNSFCYSDGLNNNRLRRLL